MMQTNLHAARSPINATQNHKIYVAFLREKNAEFEVERCGVTFLCLPINSVTVWLTQRPWIHCQLVFWDEVHKQYYTFSVDTKRAVHVYDRKQFYEGWDFIELNVTEACELSIYNFLIAQLGKTMNTSGQLMALFWPIDSYGRQWFCSELVTAALQAGGLIDYNLWEGVQGPYAAAPHHVYDYLINHCRACPVRLLEGNPVAITQMFVEVRRNGPISLRPTASGLPASLAEVAASRRGR